MTQKIIKSKQRVKDHGEVYTPDWLVNDVLNQIPQGVYMNPHSKWLEPACGNGNFLEPIIWRKLSHAKSKNCIISVYANTYGVDMIQDNVAECKQRLLKILNNFTITPPTLKTINNILHHNIICGNVLEKVFLPSGKPLHFCDWCHNEQGVWFPTPHLFQKMLGEPSQAKLF